jgi:hypothetical protein
VSGPSSDIPGLETQSLRQADRRSSTRASIGFPGYDPPTHLANPVCRDIDDARPGHALPGGRSEDRVVALHIRWFFERSMPDKAVSWFQGEALGEFRPSTEQPTDVYLLTPDEDLRVGLREGKLRAMERSRTHVLRRESLAVMLSWRSGLMTS